MAGLTLATAEQQLTLWVAASTAVASNQSYRIGDRELVRADAKEIRDSIDYWQRKVKELTAQGSGRSRTRYVVTG